MRNSLEAQLSEPAELPRMEVKVRQAERATQMVRQQYHVRPHPGSSATSSSLEEIV
jgi:hypothetical protein